MMLLKFRMPVVLVLMSLFIEVTSFGALESVYYGLQVPADVQVQLQKIIFEPSSSPDDLPLGLKVMRKCDRRSIQRNAQMGFVRLLEEKTLVGPVAPPTEDSSASSYLESNATKEITAVVTHYVIARFGTALDAEHPNPVKFAVFFLVEEVSPTGEPEWQASIPIGSKKLSLYATTLASRARKALDEEAGETLTITEDPEGGDYMQMDIVKLTSPINFVCSGLHSEDSITHVGYNSKK